jgi:glycosyltransferase involved in cell wall biosynthesis
MSSLDSFQTSPIPPLVTAIMPLRYYKPDFLEKSLASMMRQSNPNWRLLIVVVDSDFASLSEYLKRELTDERIEMVVRERPDFVGAINTGMKRAGTPFVSLLFADDKWSPDAVEVLNRNIRDYPEIDFFHSSRIFIDESDTIISQVYQSKKTFDMEAFKLGSPVKHLLCWRRTKGLEIGGIDEALSDHGPDDYDFPWSMAEHGATFKAISECLYIFRSHCDYYRLTTHVPLNKVIREVEKILKKHGVSWWERKKIILIRLWIGSLGDESIYRNAFEEWINTKLGIDGKKKWKQKTY